MSALIASPFFLFVFIKCSLNVKFDEVKYSSSFGPFFSFKYRDRTKGTQRSNRIVGIREVNDPSLDSPLKKERFGPCSTSDIPRLAIIK